MLALEVLALGNCITVECLGGLCSTTYRKLIANWVALCAMQNRSWLIHGERFDELLGTGGTKKCSHL